MIFKRHCFFRIIERSFLKLHDIDIILKNKCYVKIGMDTKKKDVCHYLFYSVIDKSHYVLVIDESKNEVITMLPPNLAAWLISDDIKKLTKLLAESDIAIYNIIKNDNSFIPTFFNLISFNDKDKILNFFNDKLFFLKQLYPFEKIIDLNTDTIFNKIIFYFFQYKDLISPPVVNQNYQVFAVFNNCNIDFLAYCSDISTYLSESFILRNINKNHSDLNINDILYLFIRSENKNIAHFIPNDTFFDYYKDIPEQSNLSYIEIVIDNISSRISSTKFKHLKEYHFTNYFIDKYFLPYVIEKNKLEDNKKIEFNIYFGNKIKNIQYFSLKD